MEVLQIMHTGLALGAIVLILLASDWLKSYLMAQIR